MRLILVALVLLVGCGSESRSHSDWITHYIYPPATAPSEDIDPLLRPYLDLFIVDAERFGVYPDRSKLKTIKFSDTESTQSKIDGATTVGLCFVYTTDSNSELYSIIMISENLKNNKEIILRAVMYHELGHCILKKDHSPQNPATMMSPVISPATYYEKYWDSLVEELFTGKTFNL